MNTEILTLMLVVSICVGLVGFLIFLWGLKSGQFDDSVKVTHGALFDNVEDLNLAYKINQNKGEDMIYDVAIVGAGPGGISAAIEAKKIGCKHIALFEKTDNHNATLRKFYKDGKRVDRDYKGDIVKIEGELDFKDTIKEDMLEFFNNAIKNADIEVFYNSDVESIKKLESNDFLIQVSGNREFKARKVVIAIGKMGQPNKPSYKIPPQILKKVNYNAQSVQKDERILIVGGGNSAVEYAIELAESNDTTLNYRKNEFSRINDVNAAALKQVIESSKLKTKLGVDIDGLEDSNGLIKVNFNDGSNGEFDRVIYAIGGSSPIDFLNKCGIETDENSLPKVNDKFESNIAGIYVIGDILFKSGSSIAKAIKQGGDTIKGLN